MSASRASPRTNRTAGNLFGLLAAGFFLLFAGIAAWLALDQYRLLEATERLHATSLPEALERQRLVRNFEVLRLEGERVLFARSPEAGQHAHFVVNLIASHPAIREDVAGRALADEVARFLGEAAGRGSSDAQAVVEWQRLSQALAQMADQITADAIGGLTGEVARMESVVRVAKQKLLAAVLLAAIFTFALLMVIVRIFVRPLQQIDQTLERLDGAAELPPLPPSRTSEIVRINEAIAQLHSAMRENDTIRAGLEEMATTDGLTGLRNRRHFMEAAGSELVRSRRYGHPVVVGLADLDHFKRINDEHGHAVGDEVLKAVADVMRHSLRESDLYCRYGGEEFAFLFPETTLAEAQRLSERLRARLERSPLARREGQDRGVTISMGLADAASTDLDTALRAADDALYQAKAMGRNRVQPPPG